MESRWKPAPLLILVLLYIVHMLFNVQFPSRMAPLCYLTLDLKGNCGFCHYLGLRICLVSSFLWNICYIKLRVLVIPMSIPYQTGGCEIYYLPPSAIKFQRNCHQQRKEDKSTGKKDQSPSLPALQEINLS